MEKPAGDLAVSALHPGAPGTAQGLALALGSSLSVMSVIVLGPVLPAMMSAFRDVPNASFWVPALITAPGLAAALLSPFMGLVGDRYGRRKPLIAFCVLFAIAGGLPLVLNHFAQIFTSRMVVGVSQTGVLVLSTALIGDCFGGARRDRWLAVQAMAATLTVLLLLPLAGLLGAQFGWRGPFLLFLAALPLAAVYLSLRPEPSGIEGQGRPLSPWSALPWRWLSGFCAVTVVASVLFYAVQLQLGLALAAQGVTDVARIGLLSALAAMGIPAGALLFWKLATVRFTQLLCGELIVTGVTLLAMRPAGSAPVFVLLAFVNLVACGLMLPTFLTHLNRRLADSVRGRGIGVWQSAFSLGQFLSVGATGAVVRRPGATVLDAFWCLGAMALVAGLVVLCAVALHRMRARPAAMAA